MSKATDEKICRIALDAEFVDLGGAIRLISIGMVRDDGAELYLENAEFFNAHLEELDDWGRAHVLPRTIWARDPTSPLIMRPTEMREPVQNFLRETGKRPEIWAHYASYDWIALCSIWGRMLDLPAGFPRYIRDSKAEADRLGLKLPSQDPSGAHNALIDSRWLMSVMQQFLL